MSATWTVVSATPYALKYSLVTTTAETAQRTQAQIISDFGTANGPLRTFLTNASANAPSWNGLSRRPEMSLYVFSETGAATCIGVFAAGSPNNLSVLTSAAMFVAVEIRYNHTADR